MIAHPSGPGEERFPGLDIVSRMWPRKGSRTHAYQALIGGLLRAPHSWSVERVEALVTVLTDATGDEEADARLKIVSQTNERLKNDEPCHGWPSFAELLGTDQALSCRLAIDAALTVEVLAQAKKLRPDYLRGLGVADAADHAGYVTIDYRDAGGHTQAVRRRHSLASKPRWEKNTRAMAYGEVQLSEVLNASYLTLVEGESDCWTLWHHGFPALGIPGADCARVLQDGHVAPFQRLYVVREVDAAGERFIDGIARRLAELRWSGEIRVIKMTETAKDPSALCTANPQGFAQEWRQRMETAELIELPSPATPSTAPAMLPYHPFPVDALPAPLAAFVGQGAAALGCDASYLGLPALTVAASLVGNSRVIRLKKDWAEPCVIWSAVVGESGSLKTPALQLVMSPVYSLQYELKANFDEEKKAFQTVKEEYERAAKSAQKEGKAPDDILPDPPTPCRVVTTDTTVEGLARLLADNPRGMLVCRDELRGWLASFTRYKGSAGGSDLSTWLEFHRAVTALIDRRSTDRPLLAIPRAAVCITGGFQPAVMARALTLEYLESGLVARLLLAMPPSMRKKWSNAEIAPEVRERYESLLRRLFALPLDINETGEPVPFALRLTSGAQQAWIGFYNEWAEKQADAEGEFAACLSKLEGYAARLALLHHVVTRVDAGADDSDPVERESIEAGITLVWWFADEAERIYTVLRESDESRQTRRLIEYISARGGTITPRQLHKANRSRYPSVDAAKAVLQAFAKDGFGTWGELTPGEKGGRPTEGFTLYPQTPTPRNPETPSEHPDAAVSDRTAPLSATPKPSSDPETPDKNSENYRDSEGFGVSGSGSKAIRSSGAEAAGRFRGQGQPRNPNSIEPRSQK